MSKGLRITVILLTVLVVTVTALWLSRITLLQHLLESRFELALELASLDISPGSTTVIRGSGLSLHGNQFQIDAQEVVVDVRIADLRGDGYYIAYFEANDGHVEFLSDDGDEKTAREDEETTQVRWIPETFSLTNVRMTYVDHDQDIDAVLTNCNSTAVDDTRTEINCQGQLQDSPIGIEGRYGLPDPSGDAEPLDVRLSWEQYELSASGKLDALSRFKGADLSLKLTAPSSTPLMELLGASEVRDGPVDLIGRVTHQDSEYAIKLAGQLSEIELSLDGQLNSFRNTNQIELNYDLTGPSLFEIGALFNEFRLQSKPFSLTGNLNLSNNHLTLKENRIGVEQGVLEANVDIPAFPDIAGMEVDIRAEKFRPNLLKPVADLCQLPSEQVDVYIRVADIEQGQSLEAYLDAESYDVAINGTLNESPGLNRVNVAVEGTSLKTIGHCLNVELPDDPATLTAMLEHRDTDLKISGIELSSELASVQGAAALNLESPFSFDANLELAVPDAFTLLSEIADYRGPLENFPFTGDLEFSGNTENITIERFNFNAAGHDGSITGAIGDPESLEGLQLSINMEGTNLRQLLVDEERPANHVQPYRLTTQIANDRDGWIINGLQLDLVNTRVTLDGRLTRLPLYLGSRLKLEAHGENMQNLFGPWVDHPLPETGFSLVTNIEFTEDFFRFENLNATVGKHSLIADINVDRPPDYSDTFGYLELKGPSTHELIDLLGIQQDILDRPYEFSFNLNGDLDRLVFSDLHGEIAETDISGQIVFENRTPYGIDIDLVSDSFYLPLIDPSLIDAERVSAQSSPDDGKVFSDEPFPTEWLGSFEGEFTWDIKKAWTTEEYITEILFDLALEDNELTARNIHWDSDDSIGDLKFRMKRVDDGVALSLDATSSRLPLVWLMAGESLPSKKTSFRTLLESEGNSIRSLMSNLDGSVLWQGGRGRIQSNRLEFLFGDFITSAANAIVGRQSTRERGTTTVSCTSGGVYFVDGTAYLAPGIVSRTNRTDFYASGSVRLGEERLKLVFLTKSRTGIGVSPLKVIAPRLRVSGTMTEPRFSVDTTSTALSTGAAFFSGGVTVLATGLWDRMSTSTDACAQLHQQALELPEFSTHRSSQQSK